MSSFYGRSHAQRFLFASLVLILLQLSVIHCHVVLEYPPSRQARNPNEFTPQGANGRDPLPAAICGDGGNQGTLPVFGQRGPATALTAGQLVTFTARFTAVHRGKVEYRICQYTGAETTSTLTAACFNQRVLQPVAGSRVVSGSPAWWVGDLPTATYTMQFIIPSDLNCNGVTTFCVLQMLYITGNSCNPSGVCPEAAPASCKPASWGWPTCSLDAFESFRNCADVTVSGGGGGTPASSPPPPTTVALPSPPPPTSSPPPAPVGAGGGGRTCCGGRPDGYHQNPSNCNQFCICQGGTQIALQNCPATLYFSETVKVCDYIANVVCPAP